jgi:hypothetical protein
MRAVEFLGEKPVESTWITDLIYNRPNKILTMCLSNGKVYSIKGITRTTFEKWSKDRSPGRFYHNNIKDRYLITRIR